MWSEKEYTGNFLKSEFTQIGDYLPLKDELNTEISNAPVAWHLDHVLLVINRVYQQMDTSDIAMFEDKFNFTRKLVFTFNSIPRGRGESPNSVRPKENVSVEEINKHLKKAKETMLLLDSLPEKAHFKHPVFGMLNRKDSKEFLKIHTNHHLEIIKDILKKKE